MQQSLNFWLICACFLFLAPQGALCFGAGEVSTEITGRAFLHGDLAKAIEHIQGVAHLAFRLSKDDIDAIYFGNWLRDYSQAMDTMGLTKVGKDAILVVVQALSFMAFGFATREFKLTEAKLGVYSHAEHIDNPKGYESAKAQAAHPQLRGEVFEDELGVDLATGMKNYIAHEGQGYNTSARYVRNTLRECIARGRMANGMRTDGHDKYAALRLLGGALHTLEDFLAHSNWCELVLRKLGNDDVFCFVGDETWIDVPGGSSKVPPLVTGTFSGNDFTISVFGTVEDKLCAHGSSDLQAKIKQGKGVLNPMSHLKTLLVAAGKLDPRLKELADKLDNLTKQAENLKGKNLNGGGGGGTPPPQSADYEPRRLITRAEFTRLEATDRSRVYPPLEDDKKPQDGMGVIWDVLDVRDDMMRQLKKLAEKYPVLKKGYEVIQKVLNKVVWTIIAQVVEPAITALTAASNSSHHELYFDAAQTEVFDSPHSSNPTHSWLAKDHFNNALHLPAAQAAEVVVKHTVTKVLQAWNDSSIDAETAIDEILETFHHPYFTKEGTTLQKNMMASMVTSEARLKKDGIIQKLNKANVRQKLNVVDVPKPKTTVDQLGDIFDEVSSEGLEFFNKIGGELEKARQMFEDVANKIEDEGEKILHKIEDEGGKIIQKGGEVITHAAQELKKDVNETVDDVRHGFQQAGATIGIAIRGIFRW